MTAVETNARVQTPSKVGDQGLQRAFELSVVDRAETDDAARHDLEQK